MAKKISATILLLIMCAIVCACSKPSQPITSEETSTSSSSEFSESKTVTYSNATVDDVYDQTDTSNRYAVDNDVITARLDEYRSEKEALTEQHRFAEIINNDAPLSTMISGSGKKVAADTTWHLCHSVFDSSTDKFEDVAYVEFLTGIEITAARKTEEFVDSWNGKTAWRLYAVFESEMGGYIYCFFNFYPDTNEARLKQTVYVPQSLEYSDFSAVKVGDPVSKLAEVTPTALFFERNPEWSMLKHSYHLLTDGLLFVYYNDDSTIAKIELHDDFRIPNTYKGPYGVDYSTEKTLHDKNLPENLYDFTILPQDYPPAQ